MLDQPAFSFVLGNYEMDHVFWRPVADGTPAFAIYRDGRWALRAGLLHGDAKDHCAGFVLYVDWKNSLGGPVYTGAYNFSRNGGKFRACEGYKWENASSAGTDRDFASQFSKIANGSPRQDIYVFP